MGIKGLEGLINNDADIDEDIMALLTDICYIFRTYDKTSITWLNAVSSIDYLLVLIANKQPILYHDTQVDSEPEDYDMFGFKWGCFETRQEWHQCLREQQNK